jgi:CDP-diacylglycerol--glycerol-3-phosphate 3-phosphatidyltransferase
VRSSAARWSALHHGIDPARVPLLSGWLRFSWRLARPLRAVPPTVITALGVLLALDAVLLAGRLPAGAAAAVLLAALCDALDGAVAVLADRATRAGAIADAVADRLTDAAFAAVLWRVGVPWPVAVACGAVALGVDGLRRVLRMPDRITAGERPTWTICATLACIAAAISEAQWPVLVCAAVWLAAGALALGQLTGRAFQRSVPCRRPANDRATR